MKQLQVGLEDRAYPILIKEGLLAEIGKELKLRQIAKRYIIIADDNVAERFGGHVVESLRNADIPVDLLTFGHGEANKNMATVEKLARELARLGVDRQDGLIALGAVSAAILPGFWPPSICAAFPLSRCRQLFWLRLTARWAARPASISRRVRILWAVSINPRQSLSTVRC